MEASDMTLKISARASEEAKIAQSSFNVAEQPEPEDETSQIFCVKKLHPNWKQMKNSICELISELGGESIHVPQILLDFSVFRSEFCEKEEIDVRCSMHGMGRGRCGLLFWELTRFPWNALKKYLWVGQHSLSMQVGLKCFLCNWCLHRWTNRKF